LSQTHQVEIRGEVVTKTYVDWSRGEYLREWAALQVICAAEPDLVPTPIRLEPPSEARPSVVMSRLPGLPMGGCLSTQQLNGLHIALDALWSVPSEGLEPIDFSGFIERVRQAVSSWDGEGVVAEAHAAAVEWLAGPAVEELVEPQDVVIGHGDPNLANYLWDGERVRIVDFEDAGQHDLAIELANLVEHLASRDTDWNTFLTQYAVDAGRLQSARRLYAAFWLTLIRPGGPSAHRNPPGTADHQAERLLSLLQ
jgi:hypothetical protein